MQPAVAGLDEYRKCIVLIEFTALMALTLRRFSIHRPNLCCHRLLIAFATLGGIPLVNLCLAQLLLTDIDRPIRFTAGYNSPAYAYQLVR